MSLLDGRVIAVAGAAGGLGPVVCGRLAAAGAVIAPSGRRSEPLAALGSELGLGPDRWDATAVDLLDEEATRAWADALAARHGRVDGLLHLVGGWRGGSRIPDLDLADWEALHAAGVRALQHTTRAFCELLRASPHGRFAMVSSTQAQRPSATNAPYAAAKAAAEAWTLALADELADADATANIVVVNAIVTPAMREREPENAFGDLTAAEDVADALVFLCSDAARAMNGRRLVLA